MNALVENEPTTRGFARLTSLHEPSTLPPIPANLSCFRAGISVRPFHARNSLTSLCRGGRHKMKIALTVLLGGCLLLGTATVALAQNNAGMNMPPKILVINREVLKPGKGRQPAPAH